MTSADENASRYAALPSTPRDWLIGCLCVLGAACYAGTVGVSGDAGAPGSPGAAARATAVAFAAVGGGVFAVVYALAGAGFGRMILRATRPTAPASRELEFLTGLGAMLVASHLLGWLGALTPVSAWGTCVVGVVLWAASFARPVLPDGVARPRASALWWLAALPAAAVMLAVASGPPGWLWTSEAAGYDTLSYHLELVREWFESGRLASLDHNVYSSLPSYGEAAFLHLAHLAAPVRSLMGASASASVGGLAETAVLGAAWLHGLVAIAAGLGIARTAKALVGESPALATLAGAALIATPWVVVVGSLAYNEMFVVALGVGCVIAAVTPGLSAVARGVLIGLMGSAAVGAKPTAFFMLAPLVLGAVVMPRLVVSRRDWMRLIVAACVVGTLAGVPWLARNAAASGNPVFPFAAGVFGEGSWTPEQHARYKSAHRFDGGPTDRVKAALALPAGGGGTAATQGLGGQPRGVFHEQWSILFPVGIGGLLLGLATAGTRRASGAMLVALGVQLAAWLALTHIQSRFLLACVIPLTLGVALGLESLRVLLGGSRTLSLVLGTTCVLWLGLRTVLIFQSEQSGRPNALLPFGVDGLTGEQLIHELSHVPAEMRQRTFADLPSPEMFVNTGGLDDFLPEPPATAGLYLLGDATPFYFTNPRVPVIYHTTYDAPPWGSDAGAASDPDAWARALHTRGVRFVLVNHSELARLHRSGWYDPGVTPDTVNRFIRQHLLVVATWPHRGQELYMLKPPEGGAR